MINPETGQVFVDKKGNYVGTKISDITKVVKANKFVENDSFQTANSCVGSPGKSGRKLSQKILKTNGHSKNFSDTKSSIFGPKGSFSHCQSEKKITKVQKQLEFQFTDKVDQFQVDAEIREKYRQQLNKMPALFGEEQFDENDNRVINSNYNPLAPGNIDNPEFYKDLYKNFKMTRFAQSEN